MSIKMIVSDLDGTLFNSDKKGYTVSNVEIFKKIFNDLDSSLRDEFRYVISEDDYFEIVKNNVSKGNALKKLKQTWL